MTHLSKIYKRQQFRKSMGIPIDAPVMLSVGELNKNKNHEIVIRAMEKLNNTSIHYAIAGLGELYDYLENLAKSLGLADRVHLLGFCNDVVKLYQAVDLYIHPSLREGLPTAIMEAIATKTPVICSNIRGNVDLVGKNATFKLNDILGLKGKMEKISDIKAAQEIEDNYNKLQKCNVNNVIKRIKEIYQSVN